jgi:hypothetical protein
MTSWRATGLSSDSYVVADLDDLGDARSWVLPYNLFADRWLETGLIDDSVGLKA